MSTLNMDAALPALDLSRVPSNFIVMMLQSMSLSDRFTCALVCKAWAQEAAAATRSIILRDRIQDLSCLQRWLEKHGGQVEVLQLHECPESAVLTALPCPQLQDLLLRGHSIGYHSRLGVDGRVWSDIAAATKLTSVSLDRVKTASQQADVVSALTALPDLEQLTWCRVECRQQWLLIDSMLLHKLTKLTELALRHVDEVLALEHLGSLTRLQDLSLFVSRGPWAAAGCPGLQELKTLTRLQLLHGFDDIPPSVNQLTALQQLDAPRATPTALNQLSALTGLTCLCLRYLEDLTPESPPLQLPRLQHQDITQGLKYTMPMSYLVRCTQLQVLKLCTAGATSWHCAASGGINLSGPGSLVAINLSGPGSLVASSLLQHLELHSCEVIAADGAADPVSWQQAFPGPGRLPHLTSLKMSKLKPGLQYADMECLVACCSSLQVLNLGVLPDNSASTLTCLPCLTSLIFGDVTFSDQQCSSLAQLTGLRELRVCIAFSVFPAGFRQLAKLDQLTVLYFETLGYGEEYDEFFWLLREQLPDELQSLTCSIINKAPAGQPPDVSAQLRRASELATKAAGDSVGGSP